MISLATQICQHLNDVNLSSQEVSIRDDEAKFSQQYLQFSIHKGTVGIETRGDLRFRVYL